MSEVRPTEVRRSRPAALVFTLCAVALLALAPVALAQLDTARPSVWWGGLADGHSDNVAHGRFNSLHAVYVDGNQVRYIQSADGDSWTNPYYMTSPSEVGRQPTVAVDVLGTVGMVFVVNPGPDGIGDLRYVYRPRWSSYWTHVPLGISGAEPALEMRGTTAYLAWTTYGDVRYRTFGSLFPAGGTPTEIVESSPCAGWTYHKPSLALVSGGCAKTAPRLGYLARYAPTTGSPTCIYSDRRVGPRVEKRAVSSPSWTLEYQDVRTGAAPDPGPLKASSLSLAASHQDGHLYLAWSDVWWGIARTRLAHGRNGSWNTVTYDNQERHVHVTTKPVYSQGLFRFAYVGPGGSVLGPFVDQDGHTRLGDWATGAAPSWQELPQRIDDGGGPLFSGRPQAVIWSRCSLGSASRIRTFTEADGIGTPRLATDLETGLACTVGPVIIPTSKPCGVVVVGTGSAGDTLKVDTSDVGPLADMGEGWARYSAGGEAAVWVEWDADAGEVTETWDGGLGLVGVHEVTVKGDGVEVEVDDWGQIDDGSAGDDGSGDVGSGDDGGKQRR